MLFSIKIKEVKRNALKINFSCKLFFTVIEFGSNFGSKHIEFHEMICNYVKFDWI